MAVLTLLPVIVTVMQQRENARLEIQSIKYLQSYTRDRMTGKSLAETEYIEVGGVSYTIQNKSDQSCLSWKDVQSNEREYCFQIH